MIQVKQFVFNFIEENTYLIYDETREAALIDCGCFSPKEEERLADFISDNNLILKRALNTHYHFDHAVGNAFIFHRYGLRPEMHRDERSEHTPDLNRQAASFGIPARFEDVEPERFIEDGEEIRFGCSTLRALLVPGHSPASLAFYCEADGLLFTGDVLFAGDIGRSDLWGGNHRTLLTSIRQKLLVLPDATVVYPGHGELSSIAAEKAGNPHIASV